MWGTTNNLNQDDHDAGLTGKHLLIEGAGRRLDAAGSMGINDAHTIVSTGAFLEIRDTSCFSEWCYEEGGVLHPTCEGWQG